MSSNLEFLDIVITLPYEIKKCVELGVDAGLQQLGRQIFRNMQETKYFSWDI
jgi:hypothetical protein